MFNARESASTVVRLKKGDPEPEMKPRKEFDKTGGRISPIDEFNKQYSVGDVLIRNGYKAMDGRYLAPVSTTGDPGVQRCTNCKDGVERIWSHHGSDPLNDHNAHDAFDCYQILECGGNENQALGWSDEITKHNQQIYMKEKEATQNLSVVSQTVDIKHNEILEGGSHYIDLDLLRHVPDGFIIKEMAKMVAYEADLPESTVLLAGLATFSSVASRAYTTAYPNGTRLPLGLYVVAESPSGTGKGRCISSFEKPFKAAQKENQRALLQDKKALECLESEPDEEIAKCKADKKANAELLEQLKAQIKQAFVSMTVSNATPESLDAIMAGSGGFFSCIASEQGLFNTLFGKTYQTKGAPSNNDAVLAGFNGERVSMTRATRTGYSGDAVGSVLSFAQSGSIETIVSASNGTGLAERFIMAAETHKLGTRIHGKARKDNEFWLETSYSNACEKVFELMGKPLDELAVLSISDSGFSLINDYRNSIEKELGDGGKYSHNVMRGAGGKVDIQIMKIAGNLYLTEGGDGDSIPLNFISIAIAMVKDLLDSTLALCHSKGLIGNMAEFNVIISYLTDRPKPVPLTSIINNMRAKKPFNDGTGGKVPDRIRESLKLMEEQGLLSSGDGGYSII